MFHRFTVYFFVGTTILFLAATGGSSAWAQFSDHSGHGHASFGRNGTTTGRSVLPPNYQPFPSRALPSRAPLAQNGMYSGPALAPAVKPFSNYQPPSSTDPNRYRYPSRGFKDYNAYKAWSGR